MPKSTLPTYDASDIGLHGDDIGIEYNAAIELLEKDGILPMYEVRYLDICQSECTQSASDWDAETCRLFLSFMEQEGITEFRLLG